MWIQTLKCISLIKNFSFSILWNSKLDIHVMQYCLAINVHRNQQTFCDAVDHVIGKSPKLVCSRLKAALNNYFSRSVDRISNIGNVFNLQHLFQMKICSCFLQVDSKRGTALACTGIRNKHTVAGMVLNQKYFVDVFAVHKKVPGLIFKLASTSLIFNSTSPIELHDDQMEFGKLSEFEKRSSFMFKVSIKNLRVSLYQAWKVLV